MDNCVMVRCRSPFHYRFVFIDTREYVSARIFVEKGIKVSRIREMVRRDSPFRLIICSIRKKDLEKFEQALEIIRNRVLLLGYRDYETICDELKTSCEAAKKAEEGSAT